MNKGISPLIAGVLLIAFTLAVAAIISGWLSGVMRTTVTQVEKGTEEQVECSKGILEIIGNKCDGGDLTIVIQNTGTINLTSFSVYATATDGTVYTNTTPTYYNTTLQPGEVLTLLSNGKVKLNQKTLSKLRVSAGNCPNVYHEQSGSEIEDRDCS